MEDWLSKQTDTLITEWANVIEKHYPEHAKTWRYPKEQLKALKEKWNTLDAVQSLNWQNLIIEEDQIVLDLGAGTGWLSAILSRFPKVKKIDALDSSRYNLNIMLPSIVGALEGDISKIAPVVGMFYPLPVENEHYDMIVASSALHHATELSAVLKECYRTLKKRGRLLILNETPLTTNQYIYHALRLFLSILKSTVTKEFVELSPSISKQGIMYDPYLGDRYYSYFQWDKTIRHAGFTYELCNTKFPPYKKGGNVSQFLAHFICSKAQ